MAPPVSAAHADTGANSLGTLDEREQNGLRMESKQKWDGAAGRAPGRPWLGCRTPPRWHLLPGRQLVQPPLSLATGWLSFPLATDKETEAES